MGIKLPASAPNCDSEEALLRLAAALGCEPEVFFDDRGGLRRVEQDIALWRLWAALDADAKRERVLDLLRELNCPD